MEQAELFSELMGDIYEASYRPSCWPVVIEKIARLTGSRSGALFIQDRVIQEVNGFYPYGLSRESMDDYTKYANLDPGFQIMQNVPVGQAVNINTAERHELEFPEYYENVRKKHDIAYVCGAKVMMDDEQHVGLWLHRGAAGGIYSEETLALISRLIPHLQRALRIHCEFTRLRVQQSAMATGFDHLMVGVVLFDHLGAPVYLNPLAESIIEQHPAIYRHQNAVVASCHEDAVKLRRLVLACVQGKGAPDYLEGGVMGLHHTDRRHPLIVMVRPVEMGEMNNLLDAEPVYAAMYLSDPERSAPMSTEAVAKAYGLTRAEAQVAIAIANGQDVDAIAAAKFVSVNTVRTQLKSIYRKIGISKQVELVRLLLAGGLLSSTALGR